MLQAFKARHFSSFPLQVNKLLERKRQKCIMGGGRSQGESFNKSEEAGRVALLSWRLFAPNITAVLQYLGVQVM